MENIGYCITDITACRDMRADKEMLEKMVSELEHGIKTRIIEFDEGMLPSDPCINEGYDAPSIK